MAAELGFSSAAEEVAARIRLLRDAHMPPLVADENGVLGCLTWHMMTVLHRPAPVGRITMLVVTGSARGRGIGRSLVEAAEARMSQRGCRLVEVTSNLRLAEAHRFYGRLGYKQTSYRFAKDVGALAS